MHYLFLYFFIAAFAKIRLGSKNNFEDFSGNRILSADTITFETIDNIAPDFVAGSAKIDSLFYISLQNNPSQNSRRYCNVQLSIDDNIFTDQSGINEVIPEITTHRDNGFMAVKYEKIIPLLIECIKENTFKIEKIKDFINK